MEGFSNQWGTKDEVDNPEQKYDKVMIVDKVMPEIEWDIEIEVDEIIKCELKNLYLKL